MTPFQYNDGGRKAAGFSGNVGDCVVRAIAIASGCSYMTIYEMVNSLAKSERKGSRKRGVSNARNGVYKTTYKKIFERLGAVWVPLMSIGSGCTVHLRPEELPKEGRYVLSLSKHLAAWVDGVLHDTHDCSRDGTRCVYGYWKLSP
jgi:hypothetical protein